MTTIANIIDFGAVGNGTTDDTVAIQAAVDTGRQVYAPTGTYLVTNNIRFTTPGQIFAGDGKDRTIFLVNSRFNMSASGVMVFQTNEPGPQLRDIKIQFTQPDTATRQSLVNYPTAIWAQWCPRFIIQNCKIVNAMTGIDMRGNSGGAMIDTVSMSAYNQAVRIDGSLDTVRISRLQYWPFDMSGNQTKIFFDSNNCGVESGRCDDLKIDSTLFINGGPQLKLYTSPSGTTFGVVTNTDFDTYGNITMNGGNMSISDCYFTIGDANTQALLFTAGYIRASQCQFESAVVLNKPMVEISGASQDTVFQLTNSLFRNSGPGGGYIALNGGDSIINGNRFIVGPNQAWTNPLIGVNGAVPRVTFVNNRASDKGSGAGNFIRVTNDNLHIVACNQGIGWGFQYPTKRSTMQIGLNGT
jgi:hypothetical protein